MKRARLIALASSRCFLCRDRRDARRHDLAALGNEALQQLHVLVVDLRRVLRPRTGRSCAGGRRDGVRLLRHHRHRRQSRRDLRRRRSRRDSTSRRHHRRRQIHRRRRRHHRRRTGADGHHVGPPRSPLIVQLPRLCLPVFQLARTIAAAIGARFDVLPDGLQILRRRRGPIWHRDVRSPASPACRPRGLLPVLRR